MPVSATAIAALLLAAGVGSLVEVAPTAAAATVMPKSTPKSLQGKAGDGSVRRAMAA